jgi:hypothetical protein
MSCPERSAPETSPAILPPAEAYATPLGPNRRARLQPLPGGNIRLVLEALSQKTAKYTAFASAELGSGEVALAMLRGLGELALLAETWGLPEREVPRG